MNNVLTGISINSRIQNDLSLYHTKRNEANINDFSHVVNNQPSVLLNSRANNVPTGAYDYQPVELPLYNVDNERLDINKDSNTSDIIDSIDTSNEIRVNIDVKDSSVKNRIYNAVLSASDKYNVDANLILAVIQKESYFNPNATSKSGAQGLMQIMPSNFKYLGVKNGYNIENNIDCGTKLLKEYIDKYNGDIEMALMAYNGGPGTMARRGVKTSNDLYKMPKETQNYVPTVMKFYRGEK